MASTHTNSRRLIEDWFPVNEISIEAIRERAAASALPPLNWLHVWWARRPLATSRAAIAASLLSGPPESSEFYGLLGTHPGIVDEQKNIDLAKIQGLRLKQSFSKPRAFTHNLSETEREWLHQNLVTDNPVVLDITAGGGSIPFEASRLGFRTIANELNPVASLILRATCEWPQKHGWRVLESFQNIKGRFLERVRELTADLYPEEQQPEDEPANQQNENVRAKRYVWAYLFARTVKCPSCEGTIPLSPNWRLDSKGTGVRVVPDTTSGTCSFEIVTRASDQSPGTVSRAKAACPYPTCGATTPAGYISQEAQGGRLGHQPYCIIYRDSRYPTTKSGRLSKRPKTSRGFRVPRPDDDNTEGVEIQLAELVESWERDNILPTEDVQNGDKTKTLLDYGMPRSRDMFSPRQLLAHGYCVQAFHDLVDEDQASGRLDESREAAWCYVALGIDKLINRNSLLSRWNPNKGKETVEATFDSHDFGMKWSYAEMAIAIEGLGLEWAVNDMEECLRQLIQMTGHQQEDQSNSKMMNLGQAQTFTARPSEVTIGPAQDTNLPTGSVDAIVFDPPYHNNVNYAELSDFFYVWLKRTAGYILKDSMLAPHLTDKVNEAIASPARFREQAKGSGKSAATLATQDYETKMAEIFRECRRVIKPDGIMTVMFTHKSTDAWDALTVALINSGFGITRTWPVRTEAESSMQIRDRAAARSTILLVCRPRNSDGNPDSPQVVVFLATIVDVTVGS